MKYFSLETVVSSYNSLLNCTNNKFWGLLGILHSISDKVIPGESLTINDATLSNFLEETFYLNK
ncbi:MAG TPA: hypothetical protein PLF38_01415, partial [Xylanibacter oryzae]|nr:hypothetical protein [Xylanibacter oryzae]